jgi:hypothetical protein
MKIDVGILAFLLLIAGRAIAQDFEVRCACCNLAVHGNEDFPSEETGDLFRCCGNLLVLYRMKPRHWTLTV